MDSTIEALVFHEVLKAGFLIASEKLRAVTVSPDEEGWLRVELLEFHSDSPEVVDRVRSGSDLPLRSSSLQLFIAVHDDQSLLKHIDLQEVNRVLEVGGVLVSKLGLDRVLVESELLSAGFSSTGLTLGDQVFVAVKVWKSYMRERCPKCGGFLTIPLVPEDSKVVKIWSFYCNGCGYVWKSEDYALRE
ncbi:MAG: hypothetical protein NZ957_04655 [Thaumarchaeota archaeon]|nr:hypothetical protein [Candidatus Calditenuaceae archaeon]MDW8041418.1 hypothetical protein [Nitrososphaerota archaeon]